MAAAKSLEVRKLEESMAPSIGDELGDEQNLDSNRVMSDDDDGVRNAHEYTLDDSGFDLDETLYDFADDAVDGEVGDVANAAEKI